MELDKRIMPGKRPLSCFDTEQAMQFIGKQCYFSDDARDFMNLDKADGDTLFYVAELQNIWTAEEYCFADNSNDWRFILPLEWVTEEPTPKHIDFEAAKKDSNFELCEMYGNELLFDTKNNIFYTSDGNVHTYLTVLAQHHYNEEQPKDVMIEKKYRPYTIKDFRKAFVNEKLDVFIILRDKHNPDDIYTLRYNGSVRKGRFEYIYLGDKIFSFESLFENYEVADYDGNWQPFGVKEIPETGE